MEIELADGRRLLTRKSMRDLEIMLGANFFRIHRSYMVSRAYVAGFKAGQGSRYRLLLTIGAELSVGRSRVDAVIAWLKL